MQNPCYGCVSPKRCPGCHDHCPERLQYVEQVLIPQRHYEKEYCSGFSINTVALRGDLKWQSLPKNIRSA